MNINININRLNRIRTLPVYLQVLIAIVPSLIFIALFMLFIFTPKKKEINRLQGRLSTIETEIIKSETKIKRLDSLIEENMRLRDRLARLRQQLPEEKEVSGLLKQISELGLQSGLEIILWRPQPRRVHPEGLYVEIPVKVQVLTHYHDFGDFLSKVSRLQRLVNIKDITLTTEGRRRSKKGQEKAGFITADFTALTFASATPQDIKAAEEQGKKKRKRHRKK